MRVYLSADRALLEQLTAGQPIASETFIAASEDEEDEYAALHLAAELGDVVIVAEVDTEHQDVALTDVVAFHADIDGSGSLAWFATQELDTVLQEMPRLQEMPSTESD